MSVFSSFAIGRLTEDPELKTVKVRNEDTAVCEFTIAVNYGYGENEKTEFIPCVAWRKLAEVIGNHTKKGRKVFVSGHQQTRHYDIEKDGVTFRQYKTEWIIEEFEFCDSNTDGGAQPQGKGGKPQGRQQPPADDGDEAPF